MKLRTVLWILVGLLGVGAGVLALNIARSPMTFGETWEMVRFGVRSYLQDEPDYDRVDEAAIESGPGAAPESSAGSSAGPGDETGSGPSWPEPTWTDFRGPARLGIYTETPIRTRWDEDGLPLIWRRPSGAAYGGVTVAGGLVFSLEQRRDDEALVAYELATGAEAWIATWPGRFDEQMSGEGPRATPVWDAGTLYAVGANGDLWTVDAATGEKGWHVDLLGIVPAQNLLYGLAGSPLVYGELVIVPTGAPEDGGGCLLALSRADGALRWRAVDDKAAYSSPMLGSLGGREQLLYSSAEHVTALDPATGAKLWSFPWNVAGDLSCSQPLVIDDQHVLLSAGYGKGATLVRVRRMVHESDPDSEAWSAEPVWKSARFKTRFNPPVLHEGYAYGLDEGVLSCIEPLSGKRMWKRGRYGPGQILLADGHLLVLGEDGELALVAARPEHGDELARFDALEGLTMSIPAAAHGRLLVRNKLEIACYRLAPGD